MEQLEPLTMLATFLVTSDADDVTTPPAGSLRAAINSANSTAGLDVIQFDGPRTITLAGPLPAITEQVIIDGYLDNPTAVKNTSLTSNTANLVVQIDGNGSSGFIIQSSGSIIRGLALYHMQDAIRIESGSGNRIEGNFMGINAAGIAQELMSNGVRVQGATSTSNIIGTNGDGTDDLGERNVISNAILGVAITGAEHNIVAGNFIGTNKEGTAAIGNLVGILLDDRADFTRIGTDTVTPNVNERNVISGNSANSGSVGIGMARRPVLDSEIYGNYIGTSADGSSAIPNRVGIAPLYGAARITIGGEGLLANRIAYNLNEGVLLSASQTVQLPVPDGPVDVLAASPQQISIRGNQIYQNGALGIDLVVNGGPGDGVNPDSFNNEDDDLDPTITNALIQDVNGLRNRPTLTLVRYGDATRVKGTLESSPNQTFDIDFYANNVALPLEVEEVGEGEVFLGKTKIQTDVNGVATFDLLVGTTSLNQFVTATATSQFNETSEFSRGRKALVALQAGAEDGGFVVLGTAGADTILVEPDTGGTVKVTQGTTTFNISGTLLISGLAGDDTITIQGNTASGTSVNGGDGGDTYNINFGPTWTGRVELQDTGASGTDIANFNGTAAADQFNKQFTFVDWNLDSAPSVITHIDYTGLETKNVFGHDGNDYILDPGEDTHIFGGAGNDIIVIDATSGTGVTVDGGEGSDQYIVEFGNLAGLVVITDSGTSGTNSLQVVGTDGDDDFIVTSATVTSGGETVQYNATVDSLAVNPGAGDDSVVVQSTIPSGLSVDGGDGTDSVSVAPGAAIGPVTVNDTGTLGDNVIYLQGTTGHDLITVVRGNSPGKYQVRVNNNPPFTFQESTTPGQSTKLVIDALAGNDRFYVDPRVVLGMILIGNAGHDVIQGGGGPNVLVGGDGHDILRGGAGDDVVIGGGGVDVLTGDAGDDVLIGSSTTFDANQTALLAILAEWSSSRTYDQKVANLSGTGSGPNFDARLNANYYLLATGPGATILNDGAIDLLLGGSGRDKFFVASGDLALDRRSNE